MAMMVKFMTRIKSTLLLNRLFDGRLIGKGSFKILDIYYHMASQNEVLVYVRPRSVGQTSKQ